MFRTAILRTSTAVSRVAARPAARSTLVTAAAPRAAILPKIQSLVAIRMYSAGGALSKEQVEGRIMSLLQGFDKVSYNSHHASSVEGTENIARCLSYVKRKSYDCRCHLMSVAMSNRTLNAVDIQQRKSQD
jgi:NADH dehydrogenase (ubiquinone) 1 alpha/beta subcomplex 1